MNTAPNTPAVIPFLFQSHEIRTVIQDDEPWFIVKDVCDVLGLENATMTLKRIPERHLTSIQFRSGGQIRDFNAIDEPGLYRLVLRSDKPEAEPFMEWVTSKVLPSIRKTGSYALLATDNSVLSADKLAEVGFAARHALMVAKAYGVAANKPQLRKLVNVMVVDATGFDMLRYLHDANLLPDDLPLSSQTEADIHAFITACCLVDEEAKVGVSELYAAFCQWCGLKGDGDKTAPSMKVFSLIVGKTYRKKKANTIWFCGLGIANIEEVAA